MRQQAVVMSDKRNVEQAAILFLPLTPRGCNRVWRLRVICKMVASVEENLIPRSIAPAIAHTVQDILGCR